MPTAASGPRRIADEGGEGPEHGDPPAVVALAGGVAVGPDALEAAVLDRHPGDLVVAGEVDLDLGGSLPGGTAPGEHDAVGRIAHGDLAHLQLVTVDEPFVEPAAEPGLEDDALGPVAAVAVALVQGPPAVDPIGEHLEGHLGPGGDPDGVAGDDHGLSSLVPAAPAPSRSSTASPKRASAADHRSLV